ncbi:cupin domain-containing protein [Patellaria atrata CBS 101060]|uniref:Cupin domain-containing protein n=1 Tax=Patellaria atrata CBS 101060 TaxID=1346257 RepID=A0A9P4SFC1_9PEZI|nr:cupin domain-containing protein [Patellaria atrata CBS 101060]
MAHEGQLRQVQRFITTHDKETGKSIFSNAVPEETTMQALPDRMGFALSYVTKGFPVDLNNEKDIALYKPFLESPPGLTVSEGTVLRHVDFPPSTTCVMHRTVSLDYGVVIEGEIEAILDSGETRILQRGDVCIQRGTMHAWRNTSEHDFCRMMFILQACKPIELSGTELGEAGVTEETGIRQSD